MFILLSLVFGSLPSYALDVDSQLESVWDTEWDEVYPKGQIGVERLMGTPEMLSLAYGMTMHHIVLPHGMNLDGDVNRRVNQVARSETERLFPGAIEEQARVDEIKEEFYKIKRESGATLSRDNRKRLVAHQRALLELGVNLPEEDRVRVSTGRSTGHSEPTYRHHDHTITDQAKERASRRANAEGYYQTARKALTQDGVIRAEVSAEFSTTQKRLRLSKNVALLYSLNLPLRWFLQDEDRRAGILPLWGLAEVGYKKVEDSDLFSTLLGGKEAGN